MLGVGRGSVTVSSVPASDCRAGLNASPASNQHRIGKANRSSFHLMMPFMAASGPGSGRRGGHVTAHARATAAFFGARPAERVVWRVLFADLRAAVADLRADPAQRLGGRRKPAHPPGGKGAHVRAVLAQSDTQLLETLVVPAVHSDHVVGATIADLRTGQAGLNALLRGLCRPSIILMHGMSFPPQGPAGRSCSCYKSGGRVNRSSGCLAAALELDSAISCEASKSVPAM